jgi:energy-coupling factor transporter transmembrane protein EcfT
MPGFCTKFTQITLTSIVEFFHGNHMRLLLKILVSIIVIFFLTVFTQIGGIVFVLSLILYKPINKRINTRLGRVGAKVFTFIALYLLAVFFIVPTIAKQLGRVRLPLVETNHVRPVTIWTCLLNRNYVRPELRDITFNVAANMHQEFPGTVLNYLEANFPFKNGFPLFPHLSHNDGKKLDVAFHYIDKETGKQSNRVPSCMGYGVCEGPKEGERNRPEECAEQGYWQYSMMANVISQSNKEKLPFDSQRTKRLVNNFAAQPGIGKILIEPHLKTRLGLTSNKVRLHGCIAVRHDDHVHVQLK